MAEADVQALLAQADSALASAAQLRQQCAAPAATAGSPLLILYGTQTGNSRGIAKELGKAAPAHGFEPRVLGMEKFKELEFESSTPVVIVSSSTGNGDAPDNADKFLRLVKRRTTPPIFQGVPFAVCALGDSNYDQFCEVGRQFDQHLERLGGVRILKRCDVDEVDGIETHVNPWSEKLWPALKTVLATSCKANGVANGGPTGGITAGGKPTVVAVSGPPLRRLTILHSGDLASEIADLVQSAAAKACPTIDMRVIAMGDFKTWISEVQAAPPGTPEHAVFIVQTIENEEPPEAAGACVRFFSRRTHPMDMLSGRLCFSVLGLGDSNLLLDRQTTEAKDCNQVARKLNERLEMLGARRFHALGEADDRTGNKEIEPWIVSLRAALASAPAPHSAPSPTEASVNDTVSIGNNGNPVATADDDEVGTSAARPLMAPLVAARWLTRSTEAPTAGGRAGWLTGGAATAAAATRRVLHLELDISGLPASVKLEPGDAIAIIPSNDPTDVDELLTQLGVRAKQANAPIPTGDEDRPMHLAGELTPRIALSERVDIGSTSTWPTLPLLRVLLDHAEPANAHAPRVAQVRSAVNKSSEGSSQDARAAHAELLRERPPLLQLLRELASRPPLSVLLDSLPPLSPRWYSLASSPLACASRAHLCVAIATYATWDPRGERCLRRGVASHWLERVAGPLLACEVGANTSSSAPTANVRVPVYVREPSGHELRLPPAASTPIVLIGPGTGLAPFRSFIQHRRFMHPRKALGACRFYFGCRSRTVDFLYGEELETMHAAGALCLRTAFSREGAAAAAGSWRGVRIGIDYVQDLLEADAESVGDILFEKGGHVYVCGDGQWMAADVHAALRRVAEMHLSISSDEAEAKLQQMLGDGKYSREIWN